MGKHSCEMDYSKLPLKYKLMSSEQVEKELQKYLKDKKRTESEKTVIDTPCGQFYL